MGIPGQFDHPDLLVVMEKIRVIAGKMNKSGGIHIVEPDAEQLQIKINEGQKFIAYSVDIRMLDSACRDGLTKVKELRV